MSVWRVDIIDDFIGEIRDVSRLRSGTYCASANGMHAMVPWGIMEKHIAVFSLARDLTQSAYLDIDHDCGGGECLFCDLIEEMASIVGRG